MTRIHDCRRFFSVLATFALLAPALPVEPAAAQSKRFDDVTEVLVVEIPVEVTRDGKPVRGLTADDFEVIDGKKKQEIVGFNVVDLSLEDGTARAAAEVPAAARRHFLLLFDLALSYPSAIVRAREAARDFVATGLHPSDLVAVGTYSSAGGARLLLGFTSDRRQVALAIETLGMPQLLQANIDPLGLVLTDRLDFANTGQLPDTAADQRGVDPEAEILEILEAMETQVGRTQERNKILALTSSLTELAQMMAAVDGRKHVVFMSEGFDSSILLGRGPENQAQIQRSNEAAMSGRVWEVDSNERFGNTSTLNQLEAMTQEFVRADCTVQSVDIGGLRAGGDARARRSSDDGLYMMADKTGGEYYRNFNDLSAAMGQMLERTSVTYVLAIQPETGKRDGAFRRLKVKYTGSGGGVRLAHRPGYFAPKPFAEKNPMERRLETADMVLGGRDGGGVDTQVLAAAFQADGGTAYVPVLIEINGETLLAGHKGNVLPAEIYAYAIAADGSVADYFTRQLGLDLSKIEEGLRQSGFKYWGHFELPPGDYSVRTVVRNATTGASGVRSARLEVPADDGGESVLLPPLFPEPQGKWLLGREPDTGERQFDYPFMMDGQAYIPAAKPVLRAGEGVLVSLVGYNLGEGLSVSCRLLDRAGQSRDGARIELDSRTADAAVERLSARFQADGVEAGDYTLEVTLSDAAGRAHVSTIPIQIVG